MSEAEDIAFILKLEQIGKNQAYRDRHYLKTGRILIMRQIRDFWPDWIEAETKDLLEIAEHYSKSSNVILKTTMNNAQIRLTRIRRTYNRKFFTSVRQIANGKKMGKNEAESTAKFNTSLTNVITLVTEIEGLRENITTAIQESLLAQEGVTIENTKKSSKKSDKSKQDTTPGVM